MKPVSHGLRKKQTDEMEQRCQELMDVFQKNDHRYVRGKQDISETESQMIRGFMAAASHAIRMILETNDVDGHSYIYRGERYTRSIRSTRSYFTSAGKIQLTRTQYRNRSRTRTICPLDIKVGMVHGNWTPKAAKLGTRIIAEVTPYTAEALLQEIGGMTPSKSTLDRLAKSVGKKIDQYENDIDEQLRAQQPIPKEAATLAVSLDGVHVPIQKLKGKSRYAMDRGFGPTRGQLYEIQDDYSPWREAGCGTVSYLDKDGKRMQTRYFGRMPQEHKLELKEELKQHVDEALQQRPDLVLVKIADGAKDNWTFLDQQLAQGISVLDFYHAAEHLKTAMNAIDTNPKKAAKLFEKYRSKLRHHPRGVHGLIRFLKKSLREQPANTDIEKELNYFKNNLKRCNYHAVKLKNLPIGSGIVEAACKSLVAQRLKKSGMAWRWKGGQAILNLRKYLLSNLFDDLWKITNLIYQEKFDVHPFVTA